jgi:hypothetical protein
VGDIEYVFGDYPGDRLAGADRVFGVPGDYTLALLDYLTAQPNMAWTRCANELTAGYAADGYARMRGIGALCTTFGVGERSAISAVAGSFAEHVPVAHIVGSPALGVQAAAQIVHHSPTTATRCTPTSATAPLAPAIQAGRYIARAIRSGLRGDETGPPFRYFDKGSMATIGRKAAVAQLRGGLELTGFAGWLAWTFVHVWYLAGLRNRVITLASWAWYYLRMDRPIRIIVRTPPDPIVATLRSPDPGERHAAPAEIGGRTL